MQYVERGGDAVRNAFAKYTYTLVGQDGSVNLTARFVQPTCSLAIACL